jgi:tetratricopeptide (TPR) repeat protein
MPSKTDQKIRKSSQADTLSVQELIRRYPCQGPVNHDAADDAQMLLFEAFEAKRKQTKLKHIFKALDTSPFCPDAYLMILDEMDYSDDEALILLDHAVKAGEMLLGPETFKEDAGYFWGILESRPYMRARHMLALTLWSLGKKQEAVKHLQAMLILNPNDNQGIRHILLSWLLDMNNIEHAEILYKQYEEDYSAFWIFTGPLLTFIKEGKTEKGQELLREAHDYNPHVIPMLLGKKKLPAKAPPYYSPGDINEAFFICRIIVKSGKKHPAL